MSKTSPFPLPFSLTSSASECSAQAIEAMEATGELKSLDVRDKLLQAAQRWWIVNQTLYLLSILNNQTAHAVERLWLSVNMLSGLSG